MQAPVALSLPKPSRYPLFSTPNFVQFLLVLVLGVQTTLAESTGGDTTWDREGSGLRTVLERAFPDWARYSFNIDLLASRAYFQLGLLLLLFLLGLVYRFQDRSGTSENEKGDTKKGYKQQAKRILPAMAAFTFISLLLLTALQLRMALTTGGEHHVTSTTSHHPVFTIPSSADNGMNVLPNIKDPEAIDPQDVCPGYKAYNVHNSRSGFTADLDLAGKPCNVYGNDVHHLALSVEFQAGDRVHVEIKPRYISRENETWYVFSEVLVSLHSCLGGPRTMDSQSEKK